MKHREFKKLRISLTNLCNLACNYCVDPNSYSKYKRLPSVISVSEEKNKTRLTTEELLKTIRTLHQQLNLSQIRFTGGEPLLHPQLSLIIKGCKEMGIKKLGLTTNGFLLPLQAQQLKDAGLDNVNISIDAVDRKIFKKITQKDFLPQVLKGIDKAIASGLKVKLNAVIMKGINENQILPLIEFSHSKNIVIRFIELMKMGHLHTSNEAYFYPAQSIISDINNMYSLKALQREKSSTTRYWELNTGQVIGIIANEAFPFCSDCDRLRLDEYGDIYGCLSSTKAFNINKHLENSIQLQNYLKEALNTKQKYKFQGSQLRMIDMGG